MKSTHKSRHQNQVELDHLITLLSSAHLLKEKTRINLYLPKAVVKVMDALAKNQSRSELIKNLIVNQAKAPKKGKTKVTVDPLQPKKLRGVWKQASFLDKDLDEITHQLDQVVDELAA